MRISAGMMALAVLSFQLPAFGAEMKGSTVEIKKSAEGTKISAGEMKTSEEGTKTSAAERKSSGSRNFTLLPEHIPVQKYEGGQYQVDVYGSFTQLKDKEGEMSVVEDNRLLLKRGSMIPVSTEMDYLDGKVDQVVVDSITGGNADSQYLSVLEENRRVEDYYEQLKWPDELSNAGIQEISSNLNTSDTVLMVRYTDNTVAAFNYVTGTMLFKDESEKKPLSFGEYVGNWMTEKWNNLFGPNTVDYEEILFLKGELEKKPLDTELNGNLAGNGQNLSSGDQVYNKDANGLTGSKNVGLGTAKGSNTPGTGAADQGKGAAYEKGGIEGSQPSGGAAAPDGVPALNGKGQAGTAGQQTAQGQTGSAGQKPAQGQAGTTGQKPAQNQTGSAGQKPAQNQTGSAGQNLAQGQTGGTGQQSAQGQSGTAGQRTPENQSGVQNSSISSGKNQALQGSNGVSDGPGDTEDTFWQSTLFGGENGTLSDTDQMKSDTQALEKHMAESAIKSGQDLNKLVEDGILTDAVVNELLAGGTYTFAKNQFTEGDFEGKQESPGLSGNSEESLETAWDGQEERPEAGMQPEDGDSSDDNGIYGGCGEESDGQHNEESDDQKGPSSQQQESMSTIAIAGQDQEDSKTGESEESRSTESEEKDEEKDKTEEEEKDEQNGNSDSKEDENSTKGGSDGNSHESGDGTGKGAGDQADGQTDGNDSSLTEANLDSFLTVYNPETGKYELYDTQEYLNQGGTKGNIVSISQKLENMSGGRSLGNQGIFRNAPEWLGYMAMVMVIMLAALFFLKRAIDRKLRI